jgi:DNA (cytosine-5)-methyltransferase 1
VKRRKTIPVVDIFAGAGGLGDGFDAYARGEGAHGAFSVSLSAEMDAHAVDTLRTRAFFRSFNASGVPRSYYDYVAGRRATPWTEATQDIWTRASGRACQLKLGVPDDDKVLDERIKTIASEARQNDVPWVLVGGPPCQAFSLVGRARNKGIKAYKPQDDDRHYLYQHYLRIISKHKPAAFVLENVKGMLTSEIEGHNLFEEIFSNLLRPGGATGPRYRIHPLVAPEGRSDRDPRPRDFIVRSEELGLPQTRHRVILVGIREDIGRSIRQIEMSDHTPSVADMIGGLPEIRSGSTDTEITSWKVFAPRLLAECAKHARKVDDETARNLKIAAASAEIRSELGTGGEWLSKQYVQKLPAHLDGFMRDPRLHGVSHHHARSHMRSDLLRYAYAAAFAQVHGRSPRGASEFPEELHPSHRSWSRPDRFVDRFKVQRANAPSSTITSHLAKDGHYFIHFDPTQVRSLTVREAARLQTFPDNYIFEGPLGAQRRQVGNAVPPWLGHQIAGAIHHAIK